MSKINIFNRKSIFLIENRLFGRNFICIRNIYFCWKSIFVIEKFWAKIEFCYRNVRLKFWVHFLTAFRCFYRKSILLGRKSNFVSKIVCAFPSLDQQDSFCLVIIIFPSLFMCIKVVPENDLIGFPFKCKVLIWEHPWKLSGVNSTILLFDRFIWSA